MPPSIPVEFLRRLAGGIREQAGNRVQIEDSGANANSITHPLYVLLVGGENGTAEPQELLIDEITGALGIVDTPHHEIHEGEMFKVSYKNPDASSIADNGTVIFHMQTGARYCHIIYTGACGGDAELEFREDATIQSGTGTGMVPINKKRTSAETSTVTVTRDPTIVGAGDLIDNLLLPGGTGGNAIGSVGGTRNEWILNPNTGYLLRLTNRSGNAQPASLSPEWYEEESD